MVASQKQNYREKVGIAIVLALLLSACGGSSGGVSESKSAESGTGGGETSGQKVTVSNIYSQPKQLSVGDVLYVDLNNPSSSLDFDGVDSKSEFVFALMNSSGSTGGSLAVTMSGDLSDADLEIAKEVGSEEDAGAESQPALADGTENFHDFLRGQEKNLESLEPPASVLDQSAGKSAGASTSVSVSVGDSGSFKVLSSLSSSTSYTTVTATAKCIGTNVIFYVDNDVTQEMLSDADIQSLCSSFDPAVATEQNLFGSLSDVDNNAKLITLFTPRVNQLGAQGGGIITGYFIANDLYPSNSSNPASNYAEILYIMVADPQGHYGTTVSRSFAMSNLLPSVLPHELQHAINYNQKVFIAGGHAEESCLNEGMSHMAEDLMGQGQENASRYGIYLASPQSYSVVSCSSAGLGSRGGTYLFLRYLFEQSGNGNAFLRKLIQSPYSGIQNVEKAFAGSELSFDQFGEFFMRWSVALTGITQDPKFSYKARERDATSSQWHGACVSCSADDNRGTVLRGATAASYTGSQTNSLRPAAARFFKISNVKDKLSFNNPRSGGEGYGMLIRSK